MHGRLKYYNYKAEQEIGWEKMMIFGDMEAKYEFRNGANQKQTNRWACRLP